MMNQDQLVTLLTGIAKVIGTALAVRGATQAAAIVTAGPVIEAVAGLILTLTSFYAGHKYNKADTTKTPPPADPAAQPK